MLPNLTPAVEKALQHAQECARHFQALDVQPVHLLHGLLYEEEGRASVLLTQCGVDLDRLRDAFTDWRAPAVPHPAGPPLPLSSGAQLILTRARALAGEMSGDRTVASEHVLLTLLREDERVREELCGLGLDCDQLEGCMVQMQGPPLDLDEPLDLPDPTEAVDTARVLDANANRAREALRVLEDYCRFALDDAFLSRELKQLRHDLTEALAGLATEQLLEARETQRDVGTAASTEAERTRHSPRAVALANCKRLQEALRSLEEFGKLRGPQLGQALEALRYRSYTLERALLLGATARQRLADVRLCLLLTGSACRAALDWTIREAAAGGVDMVQLREKKLADRELLHRARHVRRWTREVGVLFLVNDRPDLARLVEADGVHLGQDDLPVKEARRVVGIEMLIGVSTHTLEQVRRAVRDGASYLGVGPTFASGTKEFPELAGPGFLREAVAETSLPAFAIGGINGDNVGEAVAAGARRLAVSQAICQADEPRVAAAALRAALP
jgi:thiamine-phosphate pyrophosphorylase